MIPKIIHKTSNTRTWEELHLIQRAQAVMPNFEHRFWTDEANLELVKQVFPERVDVFNQIKKGVVKADIARCLYLYVHGGVYCDTDYLFYKPLDNEFLSNRCVLGIESIDEPEIGGGPKVGNAFMASEPGLKMWRDFVASIFDRLVGDGMTPDAHTNDHHAAEMNVLYLSGPHALSMFLKKNPSYEKLVTLAPSSVIYPDLRWFGYTSYHDASTVGVHLCWGRWRNVPIFEGVKQKLRRLGSALL